MKYFLIFISLIASKVHADLNLYDLLLAGKTEFTLMDQCKNGLKQEKVRDSFNSKVVRTNSLTLEQLGIDRYFFHYTNAKAVLEILEETEKDREEAQKRILYSNGYQRLVNHGLIHPETIFNAGGPGFYLAASPYSSAEYGDAQIMFKINSQAATFKNSIILANELDQLIKREPSISTCPEAVLKTLLLDENNVDLYFYNTPAGWFTVLNEDVFQESLISIKKTSHWEGIIAHMARQNNIAPLLSDIDELTEEHTGISLNKIFSHLGHKEGDSYIDIVLSEIDYEDAPRKIVGLLKFENDNNFKRHYKSLSSNPDFLEHFLKVPIEGAGMALRKEYKLLINSLDPKILKDVPGKNLKFLEEN